MLNRSIHVWLFANLWTVSCQVPLSMGFSSHEYCNEAPCTPPGDLLNAETGPTSSLAIYTTSAIWEALIMKTDVVRRRICSSSGNIYQSFHIYSVRLRAYHVFHGLLHLILTTPLESRYCQYSYFTEEELFRETIWGDKACKQDKTVNNLKLSSCHVPTWQLVCC